MWFKKKFVDDDVSSISKKADWDFLEFANRNDFAPGALIVVFSRNTIFIGQEIMVMYYASRELS